LRSPDLSSGSVGKRALTSALRMVSIALLLGAAAAPRLTLDDAQPVNAQQSASPAQACEISKKRPRTQINSTTPAPPRPRGVRIGATGDRQRETENPSTKANQQACPHGACSSNSVKGSVMLNGGVCAANADPYTAKQRPFWTRALFPEEIKMFLREVKSARARRLIAPVPTFPGIICI
jgi:hypothetical protein